MNYIGIDLGTTNSVVCTLENGTYNFIKFGRDDILPSAIIYDDKKIIVGKNAKKKSVTYADKYISSAKTWMGDNTHTWNIDARIFTPTDVATEILKKIYDTSKNYFNNNEDIEAVITVPAYFEPHQRRETEIAAMAAGFKVKQILPEPIAAAIAYSMEEKGKKEKIYVVDLGGGTFDVTLLEYDGINTFNTLIIGGDTKLGGDNFDKAIQEVIISHIRKDIGINLATQEKSEFDVTKYNEIMQIIINLSESIKCSLSESNSEKISRVNLFTYQDGKQYDLDFEFTINDFMKVTENLRKKFENAITDSFDNSGYNPADVDKIILVGGSSKIPFVREYIKKIFNKDPYSDMDVSKLVAMGAALRADYEGDAITLHDIMPYSLGIETYGNKLSVIIPKNTLYPCNITQDNYTTTYDFQEKVDIDVFVGDNPIADQNNYYGGFSLENIQKAKQGIPKIAVTFAYDQSGILRVTAKDLTTGSSQSKEIVISTSSVRKKKQIKVEAYDIALLLDASWSMNSSISIAQSSCESLVSNMIDFSIHHMSFASFESYIHNQTPLTNNKDILLNSIRNTVCGASTNMVAALQTAKDFLLNSNNKKLIILVTDGMPDNQCETTQIANQLKDKGIIIAAIASGSVDHEYLASLTTSKNYYFPIENMNSLESAFKTITDSLTVSN